MSRLSDRKWFLRELSKIAKALGETFTPYCEVILSDLTDPEHVIIQIENSLSGREVGDAAAHVSLARIADPSFPDVVANFADAFRDGRPVKSTSIGIRDKSGAYFAALFVNIDISHIKAINTYLTELIKVNEPGDLTAYEIVARNKGTDLHSKVLRYAASRNRDPRALTTDEKREIVQQLAREGEFERRGSAEKIASIIGVTRSQVYYYLKASKKELKALPLPALAPGSRRGRRTPFAPKR